MAGEIEDPTSFQVECSPTGSISFGRFEAESLCWERRSSFSHNRYLEEVEKYSKPGSVIEKKAYFEAHFRRKALLLQASSECQNGNEEQTSTENEMLDHMNYMEELEEHGNKGTNYTDHEEYGIEETHYAHNEEHVSEGTLCVHYDETTNGSEGHEYEVEWTEENFPSDFQMDSSPRNANEVSDNKVRHIEIIDTLETQFASVTNVVNNNISEKQVKEEVAIKMENPKTEIEHVLANEAEKVNMLCEKADVSVKSHETTKDRLPSLEKQEKASLKVRVTTEQKATKPKVREQGVTARVRRKVSNGKASFSSVKELTKNPRKMDRESPLQTKTEKRSSSRVPHPTLSVAKNLKSEDSENEKVKLSQENRSVRNPKEKKVGVSAAQSALEKGEPQKQISGNRPKRITSSNKPAQKIHSADFSFKSEERAEKRKEFYARLEEKLQAKEVEMNQIQAKTQEKTEAEIKQLRRSLNFKATPMPSFYHEALPRGSDGKKATITPVKSPKRQNKPTSPGSRLTVCGNSPEVVVQQDLPGDESASSQQPQTQEASTSEANINCSSAAKGSNNIHEIRNSNQISRGGKRIEARKKDRERSKGSTSIQQQQQQQQQRDNMVRRGEKVKEKRVGVGKSEVVGKVMRGMTSSVSGMGRLAVDVAS